MRLLLNATAVEGGGGSAAEAKPAGPAAAPATPPAPAVDPAVHAELSQLRTEVTRYKAADAERQQKERDATARALVTQGQVDELLKTHKAELEVRDKAALDQDGRMRRLELKRVLTAALPAADLASPDVAEQLVTLWAPDFEVVDGPTGDLIVRSKTDYRPPTAVAAERLASKAFSHCVKAEKRGQAPPETPTTPAQGKTGQVLSDYMLADLKGRQDTAQVPRWLRRT